ncbi:MAG: cell wall hydrolase [Firmicutes bacterium]|nr:cell wall hydrolase [Bacillota bacterium]
MFSKTKLFGIALLFILSLTVLGQEHVVKAGENLTQIARLYSTEVAQIMSINGIKDADKIREGQRLVIPNNRLVIKLDEVSDVEKNQKLPNIYQTYFHLSSNSVPSGYNGQEHICLVSQGETISEIATRYNVTEDRILTRNGLTCGDIKAGQILFIPTASFKLIYSTDKEVELLARIIAAEARGESLEGQIAVGAVILNRVKDHRWPNTITDVVFEKGQFEVVSNGTYLTVPITEQSRIAAQEALRGKDPTAGAFFFYNPRIAKNSYYFETRAKAIEIGNHLFTY